MRGDRLRVLDRSAVLEVGGDAGRPEGVAASMSVEPGGLRTSVDHSERIVPRHRPLGELARASTGRAEEGSLLLGLRPRGLEMGVHVRLCVDEADEGAVAKADDVGRAVL